MARQTPLHETGPAYLEAGAAEGIPAIICKHRIAFAVRPGAATFNRLIQWHVLVRD